jgi:hypothetical protein
VAYDETPCAFLYLWRKQVNGANLGGRGANVGSLAGAASSLLLCGRDALAGLEVRVLYGRARRLLCCCAVGTRWRASR